METQSSPFEVLDGIENANCELRYRIRERLSVRFVARGGADRDAERGKSGGVRLDLGDRDFGVRELRLPELLLRGDVVLDLSNARLDVVQTVLDALSGGGEHATVRINL